MGMPPPPPTSRLRFREMRATDLDTLLTLRGDPIVMWVHPRPYSRDEVRDWIERNRLLYRERGFGLWLVVLRETGEFVGECGLIPQEVEGTPEIELGYHILPAQQGRGLATEAAAACLAHARDVLGLPRIVALIDPRNAASQRVAARIGLQFEREVAVPGKSLGVHAMTF